MDVDGMGRVQPRRANIRSDTATPEGNRNNATGGMLPPNPTTRAFAHFGLRSPRRRHTGGGSKGWASVREELTAVTVRIVFK